MIEDWVSGISLGFLIFLIFLFIAIFVWTLRLMFRPSLEKKVKNLIREKKWSEVIRLTEDHLQQKKSAGFLIYDSLGQAYEGTKNWTEALAAYEEALKKVPARSRLYHSVLERIASIYFKLNRHSDAIAAYLMIVADNSSDLSVLYRIASIHFEDRHYKKAREYLERILRIKPGLIDARYLLGRVFYETGNHAYSFKQFQLVKHYDPDRTELLFYQAKNLEMLRHYTDSVDYYLAFLEQETGDMKKERQAMLATVRLLIKLKDYLRGLTQVEIFLERHLDRSLELDLSYLKANLLWHVGEEYRALKEYQRIYTIKKDYKDISLIIEKFQDYLKYDELEYYLTGSEDTFDFTCRSIIEDRTGDLPIPFRRLHRGTDYYIYYHGSHYEVFFRHLSPLEFGQLTDIEILIEAQDQRRFSLDLFTPFEVGENAFPHALIKRAHLVERKDFLKVLKRTIRRKKEAE